ncbi:hypothetical protein A6R68_13638 [Neotoma lepida]|uniref:Uncharacterized protein n=1 Tax=Neotoma lepida TaxID=56216 RepID=A0A1A6H1U0_NEOLE|nr:hypothetical protein A6R68_13638 [Neotoma lepida]
MAIMDSKSFVKYCEYLNPLIHAVAEPWMRTEGSHGFHQNHLPIYHIALIWVTSPIGTITENRPDQLQVIPSQRNPLNLDLYPTGNVPQVSSKQMFAMSTLRKGVEDSSVMTIPYVSVISVYNFHNFVTAVFCSGPNDLFELSTGICMPICTLLAMYTSLKPN